MNTVPSIGTRIIIGGFNITGTVCNVRPDATGEPLIDIDVDPACDVPNNYFVTRVSEITPIA